MSSGIVADGEHRAGSTGPDGTTTSRALPLEVRIGIGVAVGFALYTLVDRIVRGLVVPLIGFDSGSSILDETVVVGNASLAVGEVLTALVVLALVVGASLLGTRVLRRR